MSGKRGGKSHGGGPPFVQLYTYMLDSAAYLSLSPAERSVLLELARKYTGTNNGFIGLGVREAAARARVNKDTVTACLAVLQARGFIECTQEGSYDYKLRHAAEWRLTWQRCDLTGHPPSRAFRNWKPDPEPPKSRAKNDALASYRAGQTANISPKRRTLQSETEGHPPSEDEQAVPPFRTESRVSA